MKIKGRETIEKTVEYKFERNAARSFCAADGACRLQGVTENAEPTMAAGRRKGSKRFCRVRQIGCGKTWDLGFYAGARCGIIHGLRRCRLAAMMEKRGWRIV